MRKTIFCFLFAALFFCAALPAAWALEFSTLPATVRPGQDERYILLADQPGRADISLTQKDGTIVAVIESGMTLAAGTNLFSWNGTTDGTSPVAQGDYLLCAKADGTETTVSLRVGPESPSVELLSAAAAIRRGESFSAVISCNMPGELLLEIEYGGIWEDVFSQAVNTGSNDITCPLLVEDTPVEDGSYALRFALRDYTGCRGAAQQITVTVGESQVPSPDTQTVDETPAAQETTDEAADPSQELPLPADESAQTALSNAGITHITIPSALTTKETETSYWTMTLGDLSDEQGIWDIMMQPITVIDLAGRTAKETYKLRVTPDKSTARDNVAGEVTYKSQGVHVVKTREDGWTLVEAYNTSYGSSYNKNGKRGYGTTAQLIQGYVETSALKTVEPKTQYGLLIDKFNQTMYIFEDGKIIGTLLVSTGKNNSSQPWNETPAGEFLVASNSGGFYSGNLFCDMGLLLNNGCLIHEVPCIINADNGLKDYSYTEPQLGQKASHGCIRVQRAKNEQGQNMRWLWNNIKVGTKVLIWEDSTRYVEYPDSGLTLYYNPQGGKYYHTDPNCSSINKRYLPLSGSFTYGELETDAYKNLQPCKTCVPPQRPETIREKNQANGYDK